MSRVSAALPVVMVALVFLVLPSPSTAQVGQAAQRPQTPKGSANPPVKATPPTVELGSVAKAIGGEFTAKTSWDLTFHFHDPKYPPKDTDRATADIGEIVKLRRASRAAKETRPGIVDEWDLVEKYQADIIRLVSVSGPLLYSLLPVHFALKDSNLTLILASIGSDNVYNTLRLDAKQRATKEVQETALPAIKRFAVVGSKDIKNFGVMVAYGSKDFSDESSTKAEIVALVASSGACRKLADAELTEEDFVDMADVYLMDRETLDDVRKIKVSISDNKAK